ncbi:L,D-transpeptidase family protein [Chthonobacter albigriseus]|uniref:L,D-transpeptidase family protein n=1 Tax=Chthonobacter albigriseus TaxID=1683161 RepID=UPI0015EED5C0|nr:L,D-transpeptidase family protein [Chthonobacter albigriseus]
MGGSMKTVFVAILAAGTALAGAHSAGAQATTADPVGLGTGPAPVVTRTPLSTPPAVAETTPSVAAAPVVAPVDPVETAVATLLAAGPQGLNYPDKNRFAAVASFYASRANKPLWTESASVVNQTGQAVAARLAKAAEDGLNPAEFPIPDVAAKLTDPSAVAERDLRISLAVATFAAEAYGGRVAPASIDRKNITRKPPRLDTADALTQVSTASDPAAVLDGFNPPHEAFAKLKAKLAEVRTREKTPPPPPIAEGPTLKPGMNDERVTALRERLGVAAPTDPLVADVYDETLVAAVREYQGKAGIIPDGIIGPRTLAVLNGVDRDEEGDIIANMEMWRWMPRELGSSYVFVNVPEFMVRIVRSGQVTHTARVVVGKPANQTPIFSDEMDHLVVNPYWNVPESIKTKEFLPEIQADPVNFFARHGYEVLWEGQQIDPASVIWDENAMRAVHIRQVPGEANALGNIKFMFPNQHAVYLHDTPSRKLFQRDYRAYSHGCVRVDDPLSFAAELLRGEPMWDVEHVKALFGGDERRLDLTHHLKVHIGYFNAWVDEAGTLQLRDDLYGHTKAVKAALGLPSG